MDVAVVLPVYEEAESIEQLFLSIRETLKNLHRSFEVIMVNDGSKDGTAEVLDRLSEEYSQELRVFHLSRNFGQTAATACGIDATSAEVIIIMDSDGQNSPEDFRILLEKINEGYDVVAGYRKNRKDGFFRVFLSRVANWLVRKVTKIQIKDLGCSLKAYRSGYLKKVRLYGEMHRFLPLYVIWRGATYTNIPVHHYPREHGHSHYGFSRIFKVLADVWLLRFMGKFFTKPLYFFSKLACIPLLFAFISFLLYIIRLIDGDGWSYYLPMTFLFLSFVLLLICFGISLEVLVRVYYESKNEVIYVIKDRSSSETKKMREDKLRQDS